MTIEQNKLRWNTPDWRTETTSWIDSRLAEQGFQRTGEITQPHLRPWATVLLVPTDRGSLYFKTSVPLLQHELPVLQRLQSERAIGVSRVIAMDRSRGWVLMVGAGERLREILQSKPDPSHWHRLIPTYATLQRNLAAHADELVQSGVPDRRLAALPAEYDRILAATAHLGLDRPGGMTSEEYRQLVAYTPQFTALCEELAAYGIPETIDQGDLHDGNIFLSGDRYTIIDWGDSAITHPFFSLRVVLASMENTLELNEDSPAAETVRTNYLEQWTEYGSPAKLLEAYRLAQRLAKVNGAINWHRALSARDEPYPAEYAQPVAILLKEFLAG